MVGAVFGQAVLERFADAEFVGGPAELDEIVKFGVVALDVGIGWHGEILLIRNGASCLRNSRRIAQRLSSQLRAGIVCNKLTHAQL